MSKIKRKRTNWRRLIKKSVLVKTRNRNPVLSPGVIYNATVYNVSDNNQCVLLNSNWYSKEDIDLVDTYTSVQ